MRTPNGEIVTDFRLPSDLPASVAEARDNFSALAARFQLARRGYGKAEQAIEEARNADMDVQGRALAEGRDAPSDPNGGEREARDTAEKLSNEVATLEAAVDHAGDLLIESIAEARDKWLRTVLDQSAEARADLEQAVRAVGDSLTALAVPSEIAPWLTAFGPWKLKASEQSVRRSAEFGGGLPSEIAEAYSGLSALTAGLAAPEAVKV